MNCEKAGFWANHTENDADMFISWHRIRNDAIVLYSTHQWNIRSWHCLELQSISRFKRFLRLSRSQDIVFFFFENRFLQVVSFTIKHRKQEMWKFIHCTLKDLMSTKTMEELCVSRRFCFVVGCWLSAARVIGRKLQ